jgi:hypothetical protein
MTLRDVPLPVLKAVEEALALSCPPAVVQTALSLADEEARLRLMYDAGRNSVLQDIQNAIAQIVRETKPNG